MTRRNTTERRAVPKRFVLIGFGLANQGVAASLLRRHHDVVAVDDRPSETARDAARAIGVELIVGPSAQRLDELLKSADGVVTTPGLPERHPAFPLIAEHGLSTWSEFDLAAAWDNRPIVAITGTDGKTTVTTLVTAMLRASDFVVLDAGNNDLPLVSAIDDETVELFVVEASSFRIGQSTGWSPSVACWLNLAPDHRDVHADHDAYIAAKAAIWAHQQTDDVAVGNADDPVVAEHLATAPARRVTFSTTDPADWMLDGSVLRGPSGPLLPVADLPRSLPHDIANSLAAAATASAAGASLTAIAAVLRATGPMPHRIEPVGSSGGIDWYNDSKATSPNATLAAIRGFSSVVLIAGGRNKGLDLGDLRAGSEHLRAVVAIGEAAGELVEAFDGVVPVQNARTMERAVAAAASLARPGDAVVLSPACASFDQYDNYAARGRHFTSLVHDRLNATTDSTTTDPGASGTAPGDDTHRNPGESA